MNFYELQSAFFAFVLSFLPEKMHELLTKYLLTYKMSTYYEPNA